MRIDILNFVLRLKEGGFVITTWQIDKHGWKIYLNKIDLSQKSINGSKIHQKTTVSIFYYRSKLNFFLMFCPDNNRLWTRDDNSCKFHEKEMEWCLVLTITIF